jgi:hypothetical protein
MRSPFIAIAAYERKMGLPQNYINTAMYVSEQDDIPFIEIYSSICTASEWGPTAVGKSSNEEK